MQPESLYRIIPSNCMTYHQRELIGRTCEVIGPSKTLTARFTNLLFRGHRTYEVRIPLVGVQVICETCLEPVVSWDVIERVSGWKPKKVTA